MKKVLLLLAFASTLSIALGQKNLPFQNGNLPNKTPVVSLKKANGTVNSPQSVTLGDTLGRIDFIGYNGFEYFKGAGIYSEATGYPFTGVMPANLKFQTGQTMPQDQMVITDLGEVGIGEMEPTSVLHIKQQNFVADGTDGTTLDIQNSSTGLNVMTGVRFMNGGSGDQYKGAIFYQRNTNYGRGDLIFANNATANYGNVTTADARMIIQNDGDIEIPGLVGSGDRMVVVDANGILSSQALPTAGDPSPWTSVSGTNDHIYYLDYVGIGTSSSPTAQLQVSDVVVAVDGEEGVFVDVQNRYTQYGTMSGVRFRNGTTSNTYKGAIFYQDSATFGRGTMIFANNASGSSGNATVADARMAITYDGKIGVGTTVPTEDFEVAGTAMADEFKATNGTYSSRITHTSTDDTWIQNQGGGDIHFYTNPSVSGGTRRMTIYNDGRVGIGAGIPATGYTLSVGGKIIAEELKVSLENNWPDYVFADDYELMPLHELKESIYEQGHLPGIPAAHVIESEGLEVGEMQRKMMEKIEELTLYIIDLQAQIDELQK